MPRLPHIPAALTAGPFTVADARAAGLSRWHLEGASWRKLGHGLYSWAGLQDGPMLRLTAALRRLPLGSAFSGLTAAWLHGLDAPPCDPIEVIVPKGCGVSGRAGLLVRRGALDLGDLIVSRGVPATSIIRTLADATQRISFDEAVVLADAALHGRLTDLQAIAGWCELRPGVCGTSRLRRIAALAEPAAESPMESRLRLLLIRAGLPRPVAQHQVRDGQGRVVARIDLFYPDQRVGLEYDGDTHRSSLAYDDRRQNVLVAAGIRLLRSTAQDVYGTPDLVAAHVRMALRTSH